MVVHRSPRPPRVKVAPQKRATERGAIVWLVGLNPGVLEVVRHAGLDQRLGRERMLFNARAAIERYQAMQATTVSGPPVAPATAQDARG